MNKPTIAVGGSLLAAISRGPAPSGLWTKADSVTAFDDFSYGPSLTR